MLLLFCICWLYLLALLDCNDACTQTYTHTQRYEWICTNAFASANAHHSMLTLDFTVTSGVTRGWMARGSHSFTCHPHVYTRMEWAILHAFRKHSPDGVAGARWHTSGSVYYSSIDPKRMKGWVGLVGWSYSWWFTHVSGWPSATGLAWDREILPVKDRRSTTVPLWHATDICVYLYEYTKAEIEYVNDINCMQHTTFVWVVHL